MNDLLDQAATIDMEEAEVDAIEAMLPAVASEQALVTADAAQTPRVIQDGPGALLAATIELARDPNFDPAKLQIMLDMQYKLEDRQADREFSAALRAAQSEIPPIEKNGTIRLIMKDGEDKGSIPFATWEDMEKVLQPILQRHKLHLTFDTVPREGGGIIGTSTVTHDNGAFKSASIPLALDTGAGRNNLQAMGSSVQYGRRYTAEMLFNMVRKGVDDDGREGGKDRITQEQIDKLKAGIAATESDPAEILAMCEDPPDTLGGVTKQDYPKLLNALISRARDQKKAKTK